ncbi:four helix bundle protein [Comamonas odontotermitis]|uniref:four helix bundle protein n=1 Tax=Comamonas odontotermitis TaxID=379895 RepID=UPI0036713F7E
MALTTDLDIYKHASALLSLAVDVQAHIPRAFRASMGNRIADECVELLVMIGRANAARSGERRSQHIELLLERLDVARFLLRAAHDKRLISTTLWANSMQLSDSIGKQANGWLKSARQRA